MSTRQFWVGRPVGTGHSRASDVIRLRKALRETGHGSSPPDPSGVYDPSISASIERFQRDFGLESDGIVLPGGPTEQVLDMALAARREDGEAGLSSLRDSMREAGAAFEPKPGSTVPVAASAQQEKSAEWQAIGPDVTDGTTTFKAKGPIKVEMRSPALGLDGMLYAVDWLPLDKNGNPMPEFRSPDHRPEPGKPQVIGPLGVTRHQFKPPYDHSDGFQVEIRIPPQEAVHGNPPGLSFASSRGRED